jgi:hypothetical protein
MHVMVLNHHVHIDLEKVIGLCTIHYTATAVHHTVTNSIWVTHIPSICIPSRIVNGTVGVSRWPSDGRWYIQYVLVPLIIVPFNLHLQSTLRAVAHRHGGRCCAVCCHCGGMALSTWSTLQASARSGGGQVLRHCLPLHPHSRHPSYEQVLIGLGWVSHCLVLLWQQSTHPTSLCS